MLSIAEIPRYETCKESGVDWLGAIPSDWNVKPGMVAFTESKRDNKRMKESRVLSLSYGRIIVKPEEKLVGLVPESFETYQLVDPGDIIVRCTDLQNDQTSLRIGLAKNKGIITSAYLNLKVNQGYDACYMHYYLHALDTSKVLYKFGTGLRQNLSFVDFKRLPVLDIPFEWQVDIAKFLDKKTTQIDEAIAIKEQQIALLKERKQIIIQKAVTQGLAPTVPMKDSGVDWIGEIPAHWEVIKIKHLFDEVNNRTKTGTETLFSLRMEIGLVPHNEVSDKHIPPENLIDYKIVKSGQLVMNRMRAAIGIFGLATDYGLVSPDYAVFDVVGEIVLEYYLTLFKLPIVGTQFRLASKGMGTGSSGFMRLYTENFGDIKVANPPRKEQESLMQFIKEANSSTLSGVEHLQGQIEKLKEYKTTLINSAVTGKIRITPDMVGA